MEEILEIRLNLENHLLDINDVSIRLDRTLTGALTQKNKDHTHFLVMSYRGDFSEENSPVNSDLMKLEAVYGGKLKKIKTSKSYSEDAHYLTLEGLFHAKVYRGSRLVPS